MRQFEGGGSKRWFGAAVLLVAGVAIGGSSCQNNSRNLPVEKEAGIIIQLVQGQDPTPKSCKVHNKTLKENHIRWENSTDVDRTLTFQPSIWPFHEDQIVIKVPAHGMSDWFTIPDNLQIRQYSYHVDPPVKPGPPDEPDITGQE